MLRRILASFFVFFMALAFYQCARKGTPTGGPRDTTPPVLIKAEPKNMTVNFKAQKIRLYFDELVKLKDVQEQLIVSPPLKYQPLLTPQGGASKFVDITIKDTLLENTTYTLNFGQSITDNNEGNPNSFLTYVFSTGSYIDSLELSGAVKDAFNKAADDFVSVMLYQIDSAYTDSTVYQKPPNYITNTLDSTVIFKLRNLKEGTYALIGIKDASKDNIFDQKVDKIGFIKDTVTLPTDSIYLLNLFKEEPNYGVTVPSMAAKNRISFGYFGNGADIKINTLTKLPDTVASIVVKERDKDTLNFWFTPFEMDSILFTVTNEKLKVKDTFNVKNRKVGLDSLLLNLNQKGTLQFDTPLSILSNTPLIQADSSKINFINKDSLRVPYTLVLDSIKNKLDVVFELEANENYKMQLLPGTVLDFFGNTNDTLNYSFGTKSLADYGNLQLNIVGSAIAYPIIVQLLNEKEEVQREIYAEETQLFEFNNLDPKNYLVRVIFDENQNGKWDTGNFLKRIQPERVSYYPGVIEMRANWEKIETFTLKE
ncbi:Ig-like domain-containing protein [Maribacter chungangensis]|uniref:Ig-like domain-containing protein n=1 Tax=Maribacter chungangensis TaxID=1069117 RepID=A0ABW3B7I3_9FLAO